MHDSASPRRPVTRGAAARNEREIDPSTQGAAMFIALGFAIAAAVFIVRDDAGVEAVAFAALGSALTYGGYWLAGWVLRGNGGLVDGEGFVALAVGMVAQGLYQLAPVRWWMVAVVYAAVAVFAVVR